MTDFSGAVDRRMLGTSGLSVSALGMGCARLGAFWQGRSPSEGERAVLEARARGVNFFDTADCYARGLSERVLGRALRTERSRVVISTKVGLLKTPLAIASAARHSPLRTRSAGAVFTAARGMAPGADVVSCFCPSYIEKAAERSLRRLDTDYVDLLLLHEPPADVVRAEEFLPVLRQLQGAGKIRHFGVSCGSEIVARAALDLPGITCIQVRHNVARPHLVPSILPQAMLAGVAIIAVAPFGDGSLLDTRSGRNACAVSETANRCLQFCLTSPGVASVLVGMSKRKHVTANADLAFVHQGAPGAHGEPDAVRR